MDKKNELTQEEMSLVIGGLEVNSSPYQVCPKCGKLIPTKGFLRHMALCDGKKE